MFSIHFIISGDDSREGRVAADTSMAEEDEVEDGIINKSPNTAFREHEEEAVEENTTCPHCKRSFASVRSLHNHQQNYCRYRKGMKARRAPPPVRASVRVDDEQFESDCSKLSRVKVAVDGFARDYELMPKNAVTDPERWMNGEESLVSRLYDEMKNYVVKGRLVLKAWFEKINPATGHVLSREMIYLSSSSADYINDFHEWYHYHVRGIMLQLDTFTKRDSGLQFESIESLMVYFSLTENQAGGAHFPLPDDLKRKKAVVNVDVSNCCFNYALLSILHYNDVNSGHRGRASEYKDWEDELNFDGINLDNVDIKNDVPKIEKQNNLKINIHVWDRKLEGCCYNDRKVIADRTVNILLVIHKGRQHYCGIPSISRLYRHMKTSGNMQHMCERCIRSFKTKEVLEEHYQWCSRGKLQIENMPDPAVLSYRSFEKELKPLKIIYADIESYIKDDIHYPAAIASYEVWHPHFKTIQQNTEVNSWLGEESIVQFLGYLDRTVRKQHKHDNKMTYEGMALTSEEEEEFNSCTVCPRCDREFNQDSRKKVRDHCHITGKFRSALCHNCNSKLRLTRRTLPVVFHNFKCYDAHQIIKHGLGKFKHWELEVIPQSKEKFMSLRAKVPVDKTKEGKNVYFTIVFIDSFQFMSASLANLVNNLDSLPYADVLKRQYPYLSCEVIRRKGVFPYSYFDSLEKLETTSLPPREAFRNDLTGEECDEDEYKFAQRAWQEFGCQKFDDYLKSYLFLDVLLLACVFEKFREQSLEEDGLDPAHFVSLPSLSFTSAFKMTGEKIDLIKDAEMYTFFERGIRGGMTFVNKHKVCNELITVDNQECVSHLAYIDQNNLYGSSLCKPLPHSEFQFVEDPSSLTREFILSLDDEGEIGYTLEVDLSYPSHLHHSTADFPLAAESGYITADMFSEFMTSFYSTLNPNSTYKPSRKLLLTQFDRERYVVHYAVLKFYLEMGLELKKVHRAVKYKQKRWLKPYIDFNSQQRSLANNDFLKAYYKLKNNALFGKTMEDVRKRIKYELVTSEERFRKLASSPFFHDRDIITEDIVGVHSLKPKVKLDKPIFVGQSVLDYSKLEMYTLYYKTLTQCPLIKKLQLVGGDTDSFFLSIVTDKNITLSDVFNSLAQHIDTSNYPPSHPMYSTVNKAKLGCFKDETAGQMLEEMILLRPKMYSMKYKDTDTNIKRAKGISKSIVKNMRHNMYREAFKEKKTTRVQMTIIQSKQHTIQTTTFKKRALSAWEDKRIWLSENESLPHGHVDSPVPMPKRRRVVVPASGDVGDFDANSLE